MSNQVFFLSSLESKVFSKTRECKIIKKLCFDTGKECFLAKINPPVIGEYFDELNDIEYVILTHRHEGNLISLPKEFPIFIHIAKIMKDGILNSNVISESELKVLAWGELYRTKSDADNFIFD